MLKIQQRDKILEILSYLPKAIRDEISRLCSGRRGGVASIREIRLRTGARCSVLIGREQVGLYSIITEAQMSELVTALSGGALYAHRDSIASGYIAMPFGIRVGVCGHARYEGGGLVGVSEICSLLFRIPSGECEFKDEIYSVYLNNVRAGMLIYSPPGVGKTTALRSLARSLGSGSRPMRVAVVDERCEFSAEDYSGCEVDILKGYRRREGIEIATRTMSPDLIMIDELSGDESSQIVEVIRCGIPLVATAHAASRDELYSKLSLAPLFGCGAFDCLVGISFGDEGYRLAVDKI